MTEWEQGFLCGFLMAIGISAWLFLSLGSKAVPDPESDETDLDDKIQEDKDDAV